VRPKQTRKELLVSLENSVLSDFLIHPFNFIECMSVSETDTQLILDSYLADSVCVDEKKNPVVIFSCVKSYPKKNFK